MKKPLISIITISLNAEKYIEQTIQSVLNQTYRNIEYIIIDGGSTDKTVQIINTYRGRIDHFISEKDDGIADAMNKGVALAKGDYVIFIHADDYFKNHSSLEDALEYLDGTVDILACNIQYGKDLKVIKPRGFNFWFNFKGPHHQGIICRNSLIKKYNCFDTNFKICMDYALFMKAYRDGAKYVKAPVILSVMRDTGISSRQDWEGLKNRFNDEKRVHEKNCPSLFMNIIYKLYWLLYIPYRYSAYRIKKTIRTFK